VGLLNRFFKEKKRKLEEGPREKGEKNLQLKKDARAWLPSFRGSWPERKKKSLFENSRCPGKKSSLYAAGREKAGFHSAGGGGEGVRLLFLTVVCPERRPVIQKNPGKIHVHSNLLRPFQPARSRGGGGDRRRRGEKKEKKR